MSKGMGDKDYQSYADAFAKATTGSAADAIRFARRAPDAKKVQRLIETDARICQHCVVNAICPNYLAYRAWLAAKQIGDHIEQSVMQEIMLDQQLVIDLVAIGTYKGIERWVSDFTGMLVDTLLDIVARLVVGVTGLVKFVIYNVIGLPIGIIYGLIMRDRIAWKSFTFGMKTEKLIKEYSARKDLTAEELEKIIAALRGRNYFREFYPWSVRTGYHFSCWLANMVDAGLDWLDYWHVQSFQPWWRKNVTARLSRKKAQTPEDNNTPKS